MFWRNKDKQKSNEDGIENKNGGKAKQVFAFFLGIIVTILYFTNFGTSNFLSKKSYTQYQELEKMVNTIEKNYYQEIDRKSLYENMKHGLFMSLEDGYSYYLGEDGYTTYISGGEGIFFGYGLADLSYTDTEITVGSAMEDSPAQKSGIIEGDIIVELNGSTIAELGQMKAKEIFMDNKNTTVEVGIKRGETDKVIKFTLTKAEIIEHSISSKMIDNIGYIQLSQFIESTGEDFEKAVDKIVGEGAKAVIIDMRNNGGGLFNSAIEVADRILLPELVITYTEKRDGSKTYFKSIDGKSLDLPIVVMVNKGSASASELVTAALKDNNAAKVYGTTTFGKGIVQETYKLKNDAGFKLTTKQYKSPKGEEIHKIGITPDVSIPQDEKIKLNSEEDKQIKEAIAYLKNKIAN